MVYQVNADSIIGNSTKVENSRDGSAYRVPNMVPLSKKLFDKCIAGILLVFFSPVILLLAAILFVTGGWPVIFAHNRVGHRGHSFKCLKFRTMRQDADIRLKTLLEACPDARAEWNATQKLTNDPRITRFGQFLRKSSLDELPQLINVLRGDMSMVGPRPIVTDEIRHYGPNFAEYKSVRPGITGLWQVNGRSDTTYAERVAFDVEYVHTRTVALDFSLILKTVSVVLKRQGAV